MKAPPLGIIALVMSIMALFISIITALPTGPLSAKEILEKERKCAESGLEPSYFRNAHYNDIRHIECEEESRTVYY